jgi:hypothetical protein
VDVDDPTPECIPETKVFMPLANKRGILE